MPDNEPISGRLDQEAVEATQFIRPVPPHQPQSQQPQREVPQATSVLAACLEAFAAGGAGLEAGDTALAAFRAAFES